LAECFEIIGFEAPGKRISAEQTTLVVKIGDAAFGVARNRDGNEIGVDLDRFTSREDAAGGRRGRSVGLVTVFGYLVAAALAVAQ
jgi:hypothetical protein